MTQLIEHIQAINNIEWWATLVALVLVAWVVLYRFGAPYAPPKRKPGHQAQHDGTRATADTTPIQLIEPDDGEAHIADSPDHCEHQPQPPAEQDHENPDYIAATAELALFRKLAEPWIDPGYLEFAHESTEAMTRTAPSLETRGDAVGEAAERVIRRLIEQFIDTDTQEWDTFLCETHDELFKAYRFEQGLDQITKNQNSDRAES